MHRSQASSLRARLAMGLALALAAACVGSLPAGAAWSKAWTKPKLVFKHSSPPTHAMDVDASGKTHIATEKGSTGIWYVTNATGSWTKCQISSGNDRQPSIATANGVVHIAFARRSGEATGLYTASSDEATGGEGCGWTPFRRYAGSVSHPSMGAFDGTLSIAFRTGDAKLRFARGASGDPDWTILETIDAKCCTSAPSLDLTTSGGARVAYGDGKKSAEGLTFAVRSGSSWNKSKRAGGRVKQVTLAHEKAPSFGNVPRILYVLKGRGTYYQAKTGVGGSWYTAYLGKHSAKPYIRIWSNDELFIVGGNGKYDSVVRRAGILFGSMLTNSGKDIKMILDGGPGASDVVTFARKKGTKGVYYSRRK